MKYLVQVCFIIRQKRRQQNCQKPQNFPLVFHCGLKNSWTKFQPECLSRFYPLQVQCRGMKQTPSVEKKVTLP